MGYLKKLIQSRKSVLITAVALLLIFLHVVGPLKYAENALIRLTAPMQAVLYKAAVLIPGIPKGDNGNIQDEIKSLRAENERLMLENSSLRLRIDRMEEQAEHFQFLENRGLRYVTAAIIGRDSLNNSRIVIIGKGSRDDIRPGYAAISENGNLIGKVVNADESFSQILLITDPKSRIAGMLQNETNSQGIIVGEYGSSMKMELIPQEDLVENDMIAITSGIEEGIPAGLVIGKVAHTDESAGTFFKTAFLQPFLPFHSLNYVSVILP